MSMQPSIPPNPVPIGPVPTNWSIGGGQMGDERIVIINVGTALGQFSFVVPATHAAELGKKLIEAGTGLTIADGNTPIPRER